MNINMTKGIKSNDPKAENVSHFKSIYYSCVTFRCVNFDFP